MGAAGDGTVPNQDSNEQQLIHDAARPAPRAGRPSMLGRFQADAADPPVRSCLEAGVKISSTDYDS